MESFAQIGVDLGFNDHSPNFSLKEVVLLMDISCILVFMPTPFGFPVGIHIQGGPSLQGGQIIVLVTFDVVKVPEEGTFLDLVVYGL